MEFDHTYNNGAAVDWNFPSPGATPTSASYNHNAFQTPRPASFPTHFQDAYSTPQMPSYATPRQQDLATMTPIPKQQSVDTLRNNYYASMPQASAGAGNHQVMPPPNQAGGHHPHVVSPVWNQQAMAGFQSPAMAYDSTQMQTPPPTRGTQARKPQQQHIAFGTPSTIASRRFMTPQHGPMPHQNVYHTPMQYPHLQFSPDMMQFGNFGPASAPVYPQTQLLWDHTTATSPNMYAQQQPTLDDPFAPASSTSMQWSADPFQHQRATGVSFNTPAMASFEVQPPMERPVSMSQPTQPVLSPLMTTSVNPSLVYSSPVQPMESYASEPKAKPQRNIIKKGLSARTDSGNMQKAEHKRTETSSTADSTFSAKSAPSANVPRPPLQRSNTTGTARPLSLIGKEPLNRGSGLLQVPRTASPLKRAGKAPLGSISESRKSRPPSVILTIDESGRAVAVRTDAARREGSPSKAIRDRYPGLFESDSSDQESEEENDAGTTSFSFARGEERQSKVAKLDPPIENLEGLSIPRSGSSASVKVTPSRAAIAAAAQLRRSGSVRKRTPSGSGPKRTASSTTASSIDVAPMDVSASPERRRSIIGSEDFTRTLNLSSSTGDLDAHNRRWSIMSMEQQPGVSPTHSHHFSDMHFAQAPPRQPAQPRRLIRCTCGVPNEHGQTMLQCVSCTQWVHAPCVGVSPGANLPSNFTCFLCTKPRLQPGATITNNRKR